MPDPEKSPRPRISPLPKTVKIAKLLAQHREGIAATQAAAEAAKAPPAPGSRMKDGTIYAGLSPDTNEAMYAQPADEPMMMNFNAAAKQAKELSQNTGEDWRVPSKAELAMLFNNRAVIGGFDETGVNGSGWYWSSSPDDAGCRYCAEVQRFSDGVQRSKEQGYAQSVRLVRR